MRLAKPRIAPLQDSELSPEQVERLAKSRTKDGGVLNIFRTLVRAPDAFRAFSWWGGYVLSRNDLSPRDREIVILRTGWLCKSGYEWTQHHRIGLASGLSADEIERIKAGAGAEGWTAAERALIAATDDLNRDQFVSNASWAGLKAHYTEKQMMDLVFTAGQYTQVSMILNSFGVQLDEGQTLDPDLKAF
ncbi:MAG: carboxymuconolactone decarboxylase family protein [Alphaproteobacteria bacterium]|nr:carboxymuconolactone decarboxylase family protein [Alphaproteobacteria bacterium]